jgi:hypothetical protein
MGHYPWHYPVGHGLQMGAPTVFVSATAVTGVGTEVGMIWAYGHA